MTERDEKVGRFVEIRSIAEVTKRHAPEDLHLPAIVDSLCSMALHEYCRFRYPLVNGGNHPCRRVYTAPDAKLNLLCAAAHFNLVDLIKDLLSEGLCPWRDNALFRAPICVAAHSANLSTFHLLWDHTCSYCEERKERPSWNFLWDACRAENLEIVRFVTSQATTHIPFFNDDEKTNLVSQLDTCRSPQYTASLAVFEHIEECLNYCSPGWCTKPERNARLLLEHAFVGNHGIVRHLVRNKTELYRDDFAHFVSRYKTYVLSEACRHAHHDIIDLLLESGADPRFPHPDSVQMRNGKEIDVERKGGFVARPLALAIASGSTALVEKLLNNGARIEDAGVWSARLFPGLMVAVLDEDEPMLRFLLDKGASFQWPMTNIENVTIGDVALAYAVKQGLESMVKFLVGLGYSDINLNLTKDMIRATHQRMHDHLMASPL